MEGGPPCHEDVDPFRLSGWITAILVNGIHPPSQGMGDPGVVVTMGASLIRWAEWDIRRDGDYDQETDKFL